MTVFNVPEDVTVEDFFSTHVPAQFKEITEGADLSSMDGLEFTLQFDIEGKIYCLKITNGTDLEMIEGGTEKPVLALSLSESDWRNAVTGKVEGTFDRFIDPMQIADPTRYNALLSTKGTLHVVLQGGNGSTTKASLVFNAAAQPQVTMTLALSDWVSLQNKEAVGTQLFMSGKLKADGDMMFLMALQQLL
jgi:putative sterol carrier protein